MNGAFHIARWYTASAARVTLIVWAAVLVLTTSASLVVAAFGDLETSAWNVVRWVPQYYLLALGIAAVASMRNFVAVGCTRRAVLAGTAMYGLAAAVLSAVLVAVGFLAERGLYTVLGGRQFAAGDDIVSADRLPMTVAVFVVLYLAYFFSGALITACYQRFGGWWGTLALTPAVLPALTAEAAAWNVGPLGEIVADLGPSGEVAALAVPAALSLIAVAAVLAVLRTAPIATAAESR